MLACDAVRQAVFDIFVWAHFFGALVKTLILRDWKITWALLAVWEVLELSFQHILPNFAECWWDHWVLGGLFPCCLHGSAVTCGLMVSLLRACVADVFGFNFAGMLAGMWLCKYFSGARRCGAHVRMRNRSLSLCSHCVCVLPTCSAHVRLDGVRQQVCVHPARVAPVPALRVDQVRDRFHKTID